MKLLSSFAAALVLLTASPVAAQGGARAVLVPQVGAVVNWAEGTDASAMASFTAELPLGGAWSLTAEATTALGKDLLWVCPSLPGALCVIPAAIRQGGAVGVVAQPIRTRALAVYAGVSAGAARWTRQEDADVAPMASLRAGMDVQVAGPFGIRAEVVRRIVWVDVPDVSTLRADVFSIGARFALPR
jgi:hypothetical protein